MKNKRTMIIAFLLCACLIVGVGYAALSQTLTVNGTANVSADAAQTEFDQDVYFKTVSNPVNMTGEIDDTDNDIVNLAINNSIGVLGDTATIELVIKNDGNATTIVTVNTMTGDTTTFKVAADSTTYEISANSEATVKLTVTLLKTIDSPDKALDNASFGITFTATSAG